ncbi:S-adenosyl-l-methionine hydroxide adenosyltransferase family protein [Aerococcaceae bacterium DSM 111020]|nr:S-adenosyl-l-methionine hydroxide adenosyltransferase family protein [Aerococcaceae bacterium DSM 111020]
MSNFLVLQSDFGLDDGAVAAMRGVAYTVNPGLEISDLTHGIEPYNIFEGSYRLLQTVQYWPKGTVFVSVVDPGVGSERRSIVAKLRTGQYIVTPDNGTLTHVDHFLGIEEVRVINEIKNRLPHSEESHTFHGRDVYVYNAAKIATDEDYFYQLEELIAKENLEFIELDEPYIDDEGAVRGMIDILDIRFGSLWTNIPSSLLREAGIKPNDTVEIIIRKDGVKQYHNQILFGTSFADVPRGEVIGYVNSLINFGVAINQNNFSKVYGIGTGRAWTIEVRKK